MKDASLQASLRTKVRQAAKAAPLGTRLAITLTIFGWLASAIILGGLYIYYRQQARQDTRQRLLEMAALAVQRLDGDLHAQLARPEQQNSTEYEQFKSWLQEIRDSSPDLTYVYTMRYDRSSGQMVFIVDAETDPELISNLGDVYSDFDPAVAQALSTLTVPAVEAQAYTDRWGTWISGYAPIRTSSGRVDAILGIDMSLAKVLSYERRLLWVSLGLLALATPFMLLLGYWLGLRLAAPIELLAVNAEQIARETEASLTSSRPLAGQSILELPQPKRSSRETLRLLQAFNSLTAQMNALIASLEKRIEDRTRDVEFHRQHLQTAAELSQQFSTVFDVQQLIDQAVEQIRRQFDLYFAGVFLVDESGQWAVLRAAANSPIAGNAAQQLLQRNVRVLIPAGMVGWCIANRRPRLAQAAHQDDLRLADPELPNTLSEAALPLSGRQGVIGALNLHADRLEAFDEQTAAVLTTLANLLGNAIENARGGYQSAISDQQPAGSGQRSAASDQAWSGLFQTAKNWGYRYHSDTLNQAAAITPTEKQMDEAFKQALKLRQAVVAEDGRLILPVWVRDEVIGAVSFRRGGQAAPGTTDAKDKNWPADEVNLLKEMMSDLGQALEAARLYQETQRRALREQLTGQITARMRASLDLDTVLQTAVREIGEKLTHAGLAAGVEDESQKTETGGLVVEVFLGETGDMYGAEQRLGGGEEKTK